MEKNNFSKSDFLNFWTSHGYVETWDGYKHNWSNEIYQLILKQIGNNKDKKVVEIGCGAGYWTKFLCDHSNHVYAIDLIPKIPIERDNLTYIENQDMQFDCKSLESDSIDFAFSFGTFCHLSLSACELYLQDTLRVLKKGGTAIFMYSDDEKLKKFYNDQSVVASQFFGQYNNYSNILPMIKKYDKDCSNLLEFRDLLVLITKK